MRISLIVLSALWFALTAALPGLVMLVEAPEVARTHSNIVLQWVLIPAVCGALWGAVFGPRIIAAGHGWQGLRRVLWWGVWVPAASALSWALITIAIAGWNGDDWRQLAVLALAFAVALGSIVWIPLGVAASVILWSIMARSAEVTANGTDIRSQR